MAQIETISLTKHFKRQAAVERFDFSVEEGEIFGLLGHNGSGKTTTLQLLGTLLKPTGGTARVHGYDIIKDAGKVRRSIGMVFQEPCLDRKLSVLENLEFYGSISLNQPLTLFREKISDALRLAGISELGKARVSTLSGGLRRRLEIARSLLSEPPVLLLDEPTLSLDLHSKQNIWEHIRHYRDQGGRTVLLATNDMAEAEICDRLAILNEGRIIAIDSLEGFKRQHGGQDELILHTRTPDEALLILKEKAGISGKREKDALILPARDAFRVLPGILEALSSQIISMEITRPSISQVYLKLTGKQLKEQKTTDAGPRLARGRREIIRI